jgi:DNA-binding transcriptional LysR family regulator
MRIDGKGSLTLDEPGLMLEAARAGLGLSYLTEWTVAADLEAGTLVRVLEDWMPPLDGLCLYYPGRRHVPAGLRALIDMIRENADARRARRERPPAKGKVRGARR